MIGRVLASPLVALWLWVVSPLLARAFDADVRAAVEQMERAYGA